MTLSELKTILDSTGYPVAYSHFQTEPDTPYIVYSVSGSSNFMADDNVYKPIQNVDVELFTYKKDLEAEASIEDAFFNNKIPFEKIETYISSEKLFQIIYEITLI